MGNNIELSDVKNNTDKKDNETIDINKLYELIKNNNNNKKDDKNIIVLDNV
jgi:hypothetical protein